MKQLEISICSRLKYGVYVNFMIFRISLIVKEEEND